MNFNLKLKLKRIVTAALISVAALFVMSAAASAALDDHVRVGIFYGSNALPSANLANEVGSGYQFGYYDSRYQFIPLGQTSVEKITVCKDSNLYLSDGGFYETPTAASYRLIGAYHLQPAGEYASYAEAKNAAAAYPYGFPAYVGGKYVVRFEFYSTAGNAQADAGKYGNVQVVGGSSTCYTVVNTQTGDILYEFDVGGAACLAIQPDITGVKNPQTWFKGYCYHGAFQYNRRNGNDITVINIVQKDRYVAGVLPYEFVCTGGDESLKAGAVAIRTFASSCTKHQSLGFDTCTTTCCQVYRGVYEGTIGQRVNAAADATSGECLTYEGAYIQATFYAANGGATESAENTWGYGYPYLIAQADPYENAISFSSQSWMYTVTPAQVRALLQRYNYSCGEIVDMEITELSEVGNVNKVTFTDVNGKEISFTRDNVRLLQNISGVGYFSRRFRITPLYEGQTPEIPVINPPSDSPILPPVEEPEIPPVSWGEESQSGSNSDRMWGPLSIFDGSTYAEKDSLYVISADGVSRVDKPVTILTASGLVTVHAEAPESKEPSETQKPDPQPEPEPQKPAQSVPTGTFLGWIISGNGYGHNVGLSQWGAYAMAAQGFSYDEILEFYYPGTTLG